MHGSRDYYYLIKYIVHHMRNNVDNPFIFVGNLVKVSISGIARNFGGSRTSYNTFMKIFKKELKKQGYDDLHTDFDPTESPDVPTLI